MYRTKSHTHEWQLQQAKASLSEVVREANTQGPQFITIRDKLKAVVLSIDEYTRLKKDKKESFLDFMLNSPLRGIDLDIERDRSLPRDEELF